MKQKSLMRLQKKSPVKLGKNHTNISYYMKSNKETQIQRWKIKMGIESGHSRLNSSDGLYLGNYQFILLLN